VIVSAISNRRGNQTLLKEDIGLSSASGWAGQPEDGNQEERTRKVKQQSDKSKWQSDKLDINQTSQNGNQTSQNGNQTR
jgi:hypothetical protein